MNLTIIISTLFLTLSLAQAQEAALSPAEQLLERDMLNGPNAVVALKKPLRLYHYFNPAQKEGGLWPTYQTPEQRSGHNGQTDFDLSHLTAPFWDTSYHATKLVNAGPGMYLAIDPLVSERFGNSNYVITFPAGTKYIDVSDPTWKNVSKIKLGKDTTATLLSEGIVSRSDLSALGMQGGYFTRISMQYIAALGKEKFRESVSKIFSKNNIILVQFSWDLTKLKLFCKNPSSSAFVFIGGRPAENNVTDLRATVSPEIIAQSVFMSQLPVAQYTDQENAVLETTKAFKSALQTGSKSNLTPETLNEIQQLTYNCQ